MMQRMKLSITPIKAEPKTDAAAFDAMKLPPSPTSQPRRGTGAADSRRARRQTSRQLSIGKTHHSRNSSSEGGDSESSRSHSRVHSQDQTAEFSGSRHSRGSSQTQADVQRAFDQSLVKDNATVRALFDDAPAAGQNSGPLRPGRPASVVVSPGAMAAAEPSMDAFAPTSSTQQVPPMTVDENINYLQSFEKLATRGKVQGPQARDFFLKSKLTGSELSSIWKLADVDKDGQLDMEEFAIAMHLVISRKKGIPIPAVLPSHLRTSRTSHEAETEPTAKVEASPRRPPMARSPVPTTETVQEVPRAQTKQIASVFESGIANDTSKETTPRSPIMRADVKSLSEKLKHNLNMNLGGSEDGGAKRATATSATKLRPQSDTDTGGEADVSTRQNVGRIVSESDSASSYGEESSPPEGVGLLSGMDLSPPRASAAADGAQEQDESGKVADEKNHKRSRSLLSSFGKFGKSSDKGSDQPAKTKLTISDPTEPRKLTDQKSPMISKPVVQYGVVGDTNISKMDVNMNDPESLKGAIHKSAIQMTALQQLCREMEDTLAMAKKERMEVELAIRGAS